jgi:hypothetical protein
MKFSFGPPFWGIFTKSYSKHSLSLMFWEVFTRCYNGHSSRYLLVWTLPEEAPAIIWWATCFSKRQLPVLSPEPAQKCGTYTCNVHTGFKCPTTPCVKSIHNCGWVFCWWNINKSHTKRMDVVVQGHLIRTPIVTCHCILSKHGIEMCRTFF